MTRAMTKEEFLAAVPEILTSVGEDLLVIEQDHQFVAALVGPNEFRELTEARGRRAIAALNRLSDAIEVSGATEDELRELEAALDRKA